MIIGAPFFLSFFVEFINSVWEKPENAENNLKKLKKFETFER